MSTPDFGASATTAVIPVAGLALNLDLAEIINELPTGGEGVHYSFDEQWTGKYWVDGKKIYQKTVSCGALTNKTTKYVAHGVPDIDNVLSMKGFSRGIYSGKRVFIGLPYSGHLQVHEQEGDLVLASSTNLTVYSESYITLHYTRAGE